MKKILLCIVVLAAVLCGCDGYGDPFFCDPIEQTVDNLTLTISPKAELITVLSVLSEEQSDYMITEESSYRNEILTRFKKRKEHRAVIYYKEKGFDFSIMSEFAMMVNNNFTLTEDLMNYETSPNCTEDEKRIMEYVSAKAPVKEVLSNLQAFYQESNFQRFFKRNKGTFKNNLKTMADEFEEYDIIPWTNKYFENEGKNYTAVIQLLRKNAVSDELTNLKVDEEGNKSKDLISYIFTTPSYGKYGAGIIVEKIAEDYLEKLSEKYKDKIGEYAYLIENIGENPKNAGYDTWNKVFNKQVSEGIISRFILKIWGQEEYDTYIKQNVDWGYTYQREISDKLAEFEENPDKYSHIGEFYEEIISPA